IPIVVPLAAAALFLIRTWAVSQNSGQSNWAEPLTILALISLLCTTTVPLIRPQWFEKDRVLRLTLLALALPLIYYIWTMAGFFGAGVFAGVVS
ncbi:MAG: hypothetical protein R3186_11155, partial [Ruegeria sp.]|nr:hypothetical protein [Ruegeria sp.]